MARPARADRTVTSSSADSEAPNYLEVLDTDLDVVEGPGRRFCDWCRGGIPVTARRDSVCCSTRCRQARHRFHRAVGRGVASGRPLRLAYADPPYPGKSGYYRNHPDYAGEVDQAELIRRLSTYDGWALSTSAAALRDVLASCPPGVRIAAWHRGARPNPKALGVLNAWEPVIFYGGRAVVSEFALTGGLARVRRPGPPDGSGPSDRLETGRLLALRVPAARRDASRHLRGPLPRIGRAAGAPGMSSAVPPARTTAHPSPRTYATRRVTPAHSYGS